MARSVPPQSWSDEAPLVPDIPAAVRRGTLAVVGAQVATQVISLVVLAVLYRRIGPEPFGYMGMAVPLILILRVFASFGLNVATVQRPGLSRDELDSLFWTQLICGGLTFVLTAACAPLLATVYRVAELMPIVLALSATTLLVSLATQHQALMERRMRITQLALLRLAAQLMGGIAAMVTAYAGWGVWALVSQQYVELAVILAFAWAFEPWRPRRPGPIGSIGKLLTFGGYWTASSLILALGQNADKFLLAVWVAASPTGLSTVGMYTQAFQLMMKPVYLVTTPISGIMLPALARVAAQRAMYQSFLVSFYRMVTIVLLPCSVGLAVVAGDVMQVLGGDTWSPAGLILTLLAPAILAQGFVNLLGTVFASAGRNDRLLRASVVVTCILGAGHLIGIWLGSAYGPPGIGPATGLAIAYSVLLLGIVYPYTAYAWKSVDVELHVLITELRGPLLAACVMGLTVVGLRLALSCVPACSPIWRLGILVLSGTAIYVCLAFKELAWLKRQMVRASA